MNTVIDSDVLMIGHVSRDRLVVNGHAASFTGGAVHYGSNPLRCIGLKTAVETRLHSADFDLLADMERAGVHVVRIPASQTCQMEIIYDTANQEQRTCRASGFAGTYRYADIPDLPRRVTMITPLTAGEVDIALIRRLAWISPLSLDVQGFVRVRRENRLVFRDWQEKADCLPLIRFLKMDQVEGEELTGLIDPAEAVRAVVDMGASEVMITYRGGVLVYSDGQYHRAAVSSPVGNGRTGRGDTCFATYVGLRLRWPAAKAIQWAAALTALKMERPGPFSGTLTDVEQKVTALKRTDHT